MFPGGAVLTDGDRIVGSGGAESSTDDISEETMGRVFDESTFTDFALTCRADEVTEDRVFTVGDVAAG